MLPSLRSRFLTLSAAALFAAGSLAHADPIQSSADQTTFTSEPVVPEFGHDELIAHSNLIDFNSAELPAQGHAPSFAAFEPSPSPEPSSIVLFGSGLLVAAGLMYRRMNA